MLPPPCALERFESSGRERLGRAVFRHFVAGRMSIAYTFGFMQEHQRHHARQIARLRAPSCTPALIRDAAKNHPTMSEFVRRLRAKGVQVRANIARIGHVSGISYGLDRVAVKGSGLGRAHSFEGLQKEQGVRYDKGRDLQALERAARATKGMEPLRERRRPLRLPSPSQVLSRLGGYQEARTALWLAHNLELAGRAPGRAALNIAERLLPSDARAAVRAIRSIIDLSRGR